MRVALWSTFWIHFLVLALGMFGLVSAVPNPGQFAGNASAMTFYVWATQNLGAVDIVTGAIAMLFYGVVAIGPLRTGLFFVISYVLSATAELTGTATGWPFGGYEYTHLLGWQILGRVPFSVPLSWFYMGFAAYLVAVAILSPGTGRPTRGRALLVVLLGAWLLSAWDLVLDPAMASDKMSYMHFWIWHEHGPYFGMPLRNLVGWFATGFVFIGAARLAWRHDLRGASFRVAFPLAVYVVNVVWAMALGLTVGEWQSAVLATVFSLVPALLSLRGTRIPRAAAPAKAA